jgi:hypothetical protein
MNSITSNKKKCPPWKEKLICIFSVLILIKNEIQTLIFPLAVFEIIKPFIYGYNYLVIFESNLQSLKNLEQFLININCYP